jgi:hypothetical protein
MMNNDGENHESDVLMEGESVNKKVMILPPIKDNTRKSFDGKFKEILE